VKISGANTSLSKRTLKMIRQLNLNFKKSSSLLKCQHGSFCQAIGKRFFIFTGGKGRRKHKKGKKR
jgi:hypothetical protein